MFSAFKRSLQKTEKTKSFGGKCLALWKGTCKWLKKLSLLAGKKAGLLDGVGWWVKNKLSLLAGKICAVCKQISPIKNPYLFWFVTWPCLKVQKFFPASATLHSQKIVKREPTFWLVYRPLLKAQYFLFFIWK